MSASNSPLLGELLRTRRIGAGLSQEALSESSTVSVRTISDLERGQRASAHLTTIRLLAEALGLSDNQRQDLLVLAQPGPSTGNEAPHPSLALRRSTPPWAPSLPTPGTPFIGRRQTLDALATILTTASRGVVTVTGTGGVGKTRIAVEAGYRLAQTLEDGVAFVDLALVTEAARVPDAIAEVLGLTMQSESTSEQLASFLSSRELLLILDNFEHLLDAAPFVAQLDTACPKLAILVTSRVRLRLSNEREFVLSPLPLANVTDSLERLQANEANVLFAERARRCDPNFTLSDQNAVAVTEICHRLDGLPLAIELAASRLRVLPVPALLERLDRRLPLLTGGDRDRPAHQQSMRATIGWSYDLLPPNGQRFLRWMSVFVGGLSLESAEALGQATGLDPIESLEVVTNLVETGLVIPSRSTGENTRFYLLETIREFGLEQLVRTSELEAARRFHAEHFLEFASKDAPRPDELVRDAWIGRIMPEYSNLVPAFDAICSPETATQSARFAAALAPYWDYRGPIAEAAPRLKRALAIAPEGSIDTLHAFCWTSFVLGTSSDYDGALNLANRSLEMAHAIGTPSDQAAALQALATVFEYHEEFDRARELLEQAMELWEAAKNTVLHAVCLMLHVGLEYARGDLSRAMGEAERARQVFQDEGEIGWTAGVIWYQGMIAIAQGELALGATFYGESLRAGIQSESPPLWFKPLVGLADVGAAVGSFAEASRLLGATDELLALTGAELMPFDRPGYERAGAACRTVLGSEHFGELVAEGRLLIPEEWLGLSNAIAECAVSQTRSGSHCFDSPKQRE